MSTKKLVYVDLDDTVADFQGSDVFKAIPLLDESLVAGMHSPGFFRNLKPIAGALRGVRELIKMGYDVHILTMPLAESALSYSEKVQWVGMWFPELITKIHMTQNKGLFLGDYLIDDNAKKWKDKFERNGGKFYHFEYKRFDDDKNEESWEQITTWFMRQKCLDTGTTIAETDSGEMVSGGNLKKTISKI